MSIKQKQSDSIPNKARNNKRPAEMYPELVALLARASVLTKLLHDELSHQNVADNLGISKQGFSRHAGKVKVEVK